MKRTVTIQMDQVTFDKIRQVAKVERRSLSAQAVYLVEQGLARHERLDTGAGQARELAEALAGTTAQPDPIEAAR